MSDVTMDHSVAPTRGPVRWGVLGPGMLAIERTIPAIISSPVANLATIASRNGDRAAALAADWPDCVAYGAYDQLLTDPTVDAVYISLPSHLPMEWTICCWGKRAKLARIEQLEEA